jgi:hypothetical protein
MKKLSIGLLCVFCLSFLFPQSKGEKDENRILRYIYKKYFKGHIERNIGGRKLKRLVKKWLPGYRLYRWGRVLLAINKDGDGYDVVRVNLIRNLTLITFPIFDEIPIKVKDEREAKQVTSFIYLLAVEGCLRSQGYQMPRRPRLIVDKEGDEIESVKIRRRVNRHGHHFTFLLKVYFDEGELEEIRCNTREGWGREEEDEEDD